ncbi:MAG TPA: 30S ribosomal protein S16 [Thermomicrobiales bacterium]|nr:30S ribosomal protein S16 [Thermomicrobiales bacterium]
MIKLRLRRMGAKKRPSYRIVAAESASPRDGRIIEAVGFYDPLTDPATITVNEERVKHWLSNGAQPTETVADIFRRQGLMPKADGTFAVQVQSDSEATASA